MKGNEDADKWARCKTFVEGKCRPMRFNGYVMRDACRNCRRFKIKDPCRECRWNDGGFQCIESYKKKAKRTGSCAHFEIGYYP